jgi:glycerophosphoryl diester phosphodiesterase
MNIAHRGASAYAPENTMAAFELAVEMGADTLELDIQLTKDGQIVVMHDLNIDRTSDGTGYIRNMTYEELSQFNYYYKFKNQYDAGKCQILKLEQVIEFAKEHDLSLNIKYLFAH